MKRKKILIVEDETSSLQALKEAFEQQGYQVAAATNGEEALVMLQKDLPSIILLDIILPKMDGFEVLQQLKKNKTTQSIPVILLTNLSQPQDIERAIALGATTYLVKSEYQLEDIIHKVDEQLE